MEDRRSRFLQGYDSEKLQKQREAKEIELRRQQRYDQSFQRRNIPSMERDWIKVSEIYKEKYDISDLPDLLEAAQSTDDGQLLFAAQGLRKLLSTSVNTPIQQVIDTGVIPRVLQWIQRFDFTQLQYEACWILTNISAGNSLQTQTIIEKGAVPILINLLGSTNETVREQAVWTLGNIGGDSSSCRDLILQHNGLALVAQVGEMSERPSLKNNVYWTISNFCRGKPPPAYSMVKGALPILAKAIETQTTPDLLSDCMYSLATITEGNDEKVQALIDTGVVPKIIQHLNHHINIVAHPALKTIGNIAQGSEHQTQYIIDLGVVPSLYSLLACDKRNIVKEAVWTISNISAGTLDQLQVLYDSNVFPRVVNILMNSDVEIKKEAAWAICNAVSVSSPEQISALVRAGSIEALCGMLKMHSNSQQVTPEILTVVMKGLTFFLDCGKSHFNEGGLNPFTVNVENCGGLKALEDLQRHPNSAVYTKALKILEDYFELEEDENSDLIQAIMQCTQFKF